jgi:hypothetical protein
MYKNIISSWLRHYATSRKVAGSIYDMVVGFFNWPNPSSRTMALGSAQPLTEMSTRNILGSKGRSARTAVFTAICEPIVYKMWEPRRLTNLWASTACYRDSFTFIFTFNQYSSTEHPVSHIDNCIFRKFNKYLIMEDAVCLILVRENFPNLMQQLRNILCNNLMEISRFYESKQLWTHIILVELSFSNQEVTNNGIYSVSYWRSASRISRV